MGNSPLRVVLLLGDKGGVRSGYLNLDASIAAPPEDVNDPRLPCSLNDWPQVSANEAEEVVACGILDRLPPEHVEDVFFYWAGRLAHGGSLVVSAMDYLEACDYLVGQAADTGVANGLLYGRKSAHTMESLVKLAEAKGLQVRKRFWRGLEAFVEAVRP